MTWQPTTQHLVIICLTVLGLVCIAAELSAPAKDVLLLITGGLVGYLAPSGKDKE